MNTHYLSPAETAKLIRARLKKAFPRTKFSVRSDSYSGGGSVRVKWMDGPAATLVESIVGSYAGGRFDGSIDMKISVRHWLLPDGTVRVASNPGTQGSMGYIAAEREWMPDPDCKLVSFGADFVFTSRTISPAFAEKIMARLIRKGLPENTLKIDRRDNGEAGIVTRLGVNFDDARYWERQANVEQSRFMVAGA
ncbi:LPD29 domain-containing protein [Acetobacter conturbans]|uniref:Large polyvalent protein associated domain-containing protein n=1 Tax=Acetobacter conturbans TaxID=1737472 RepID=A0ABX0K7D7_9PROT|nr:LPD29 domain-containing protein [Acetobacter conturbans]NHN89842.1 hypothetical protein [Acetobacter conturbans]